MLENVPQLELVRLAAFMDGEGSIVLGNQKRRIRNLRLQLCNTDPRLILWAKELFGGSMSREIKHGKVKNTRNIFRWHVSSKQAELLLKAILPYLILKKEQAEVALAYRTTVGSVGKRVSEETNQKRIDLNKQLSELKHINYCVETFEANAILPGPTLNH
jgi:hypothetical protein